MSLSIALSTASRSLRAIETQMAVASSNLSNADVDGYTRKSATKVTQTTAGIGTGVEITTIASKVDPWLVKGIIAATSSDQAAAATSDYLDRLGDALGSLSSDSSSGGDTLATTLSSLVSALTELAATPDSGTLKGTTVTALDDVAADLRDTSSAVQDLRQGADNDIAAAVETANSALATIDKLNDSIVRAKSSGQSTADLEDQRLTALSDLSKVIGISSFTQSNGAVSIYTDTGEALLTSKVHTLSYVSSGTVTSDTAYPGGFSGIMIDQIVDDDGTIVSPGTDITGKIGNGSIAALVTLRDDTLPAVQDQLDALATSLRDSLNSVHNDGTASPPPNSLTGSVEGVTSLGMSGTLRVVVTDSAGKTVSGKDIDLSAISNVSDLASALSSAGLGLTASVDADGRLTIATTDTTQGVALSGGEVTAINGTTVTSQSVSSALGLNDLVTGTGAEDIGVRADILAKPARLATATVSQSSTALNTGTVSVSVGSGAQVQAMATILESAKLTTTAGTIVSDASGKLEAAQSEASARETTLSSLTSSFSSKYGVNINEETATISALENAYTASAQVLSAVQSMFDDLIQAMR
jgi:flagellar hook-associated protein 1 FlgK